LTHDGALFEVHNDCCGAGKKQKSKLTELKLRQITKTHSMHTLLFLLYVGG